MGMAPSARSTTRMEAKSSLPVLPVEAPDLPGDKTEDVSRQVRSAKTLDVR